MAPKAKEVTSKRDDFCLLKFFFVFAQVSRVKPVQVFSTDAAVG